MNTKSRRNWTITGLMLVMLLPLFLTACAKGTAASQEETFVGIVTDAHCFLKKPDLELDSKKCLQMPACAATGYGVAVVQPDKTYKFYFLDGEFAPNATGAQATAAKLIAASTRTDHFYFTVKGTLSDKTKTIAFEKTYPVINVASIVESDK